MRVFHLRELNIGRFELLISVFAQRFRQVVQDPVLQKWLIGRMLGRYSSVMPFQAHQPPYLTKYPRSDSKPVQSPGEHKTNLVAHNRVHGPLNLPLAGMDVLVAPETVSDLFNQQFSDTETLLSLQRFAWVPLLEEALDPAWVDTIWQVWVQGHGVPEKGWAWHPYTVAERAINILNFSSANGYPGDPVETIEVLHRHADVIADGLEYWGDHNTSNHLANNGRGLYRIGLTLGLDWAVNMGRDILLNEAERIFMPSGILREGSSHYHLLYTQRYIDVWLAARAHSRPEASPFRQIAGRALSILPHLHLPAGFPLIGDISPDQPPLYLSGLLTGHADHWMRSLSDAEYSQVTELQSSAKKPLSSELLCDGWVRQDFDAWSALWHVSPAGWPSMPGHGHQDCGSFELHFDTERVVVDPGRGAYDNSEESASFYAAGSHNLLTIDGASPYPDNRPYYDDAFRTDICGPAPSLQQSTDCVTLEFSGFSRLQATGTVRRDWTFQKSRVVISDQVKGSRQATLARHLHTSLPVMLEDGAVILKGETQRFKISCENVDPKLNPTRIWQAYGKSGPGNRISFHQTVNLPWSGSITIEGL